MSLKRDRALAKLDKLMREIESGGLPVPSNLFHVAALTRRLARMLADPRDPRRAGTAARLVGRLADLSFAATGDAARLACRKGCALCCRGFVSAPAPQIFALADAIRNGPDADRLGERVEAAASRTAGMDVEARLRAHVPCPLLEDERCVRYADRPLSCRHFASWSLPACEAAFAGGDIAIEGPPSWANLRSAYASALRAALRLVGRGAAEYELNQALARALRTPDAEARWLRGEPVFEGVAVDATADAGTRALRPVIVEALTAVARGDAPPEFLSSEPGG